MGRKSSGQLRSRPEEFRRLNHVSSVRQVFAVIWKGERLWRGKPRENMGVGRDAADTTSETHRWPTSSQQKPPCTAWQRAGNRWTWTYRGTAGASGRIRLRIGAAQKIALRLPAFTTPELDLCIRGRVEASLQQGLGVLLENVLNLLRSTVMTAPLRKMHAVLV